MLCQKIEVRQIGINGEAIKGDGKVLMVNGEVLKRNEDALKCQCEGFKG